jgi:hypothetical protein
MAKKEIASTSASKGAVGTSTHATVCVSGEAGNLNDAALDQHPCPAMPRPSTAVSRSDDEGMHAGPGTDLIM